MTFHNGADYAFSSTPPVKASSALLFVDIYCWQEIVLLMYTVQLRTQNLLLQKAPSNLFLHSSKKCSYVNPQLFRNFIISG